MLADAPINNPPAPEPKDGNAEQGKKDTPAELPPIVSASDSPPPAKYKYHSQSLVSEVREWGKFSVEFLTLIAVIVYACIASHQLTAMLDANTINHAALVATQRAYVSVTGLNIEQSQFNPKLVTYIVSPIIVNSGNTPTKNLWFTAVMGTPPVPVDKEPTIQDLTGATHNFGTLGARQEVRDLIKQPIPTEYATILRQSFAHKHIPIYGAIVYEDGISDPPILHIRRYCYSLYVNPYFTPPTSFSYVMCGGRSNCEDEECDEATQQQMKVIRAAKRN
jgi:hypothetical protein